MKRETSYKWRLAELMARDSMHNSTDLIPHLREHDIDLSSSQVYRLVTSQPERVSLKLVAVICDIFNCDPNDLVTVTANDAQRKKTATASNVVDLNKSIRPKRARVVRDDD